MTVLYEADIGNGQIGCLCQGTLCNMFFPADTSDAKPHQTEVYGYHILVILSMICSNIRTHFIVTHTYNLFKFRNQNIIRMRGRKI